MAGEPGRSAHGAWAGRLEASEQRAAFLTQMAAITDLVPAAIEGHIRGLAAAPQKIATRKASEMALGPLTAAIRLGSTSEPRAASCG